MIKKALLYFVIITVSLYVLRFLHYEGLRQQTKGYYGKLNKAFNCANNYDVIFLGSSRAEMHYDTRIFDSITGLRSFNLGLSGATPNMALAALKTYLVKSKVPKHLVYEVDFHGLQLPPNAIYDFNNYFPYLNHPVLRQELSKIDARMGHFFYNPFYSWPFTGLKNISTGLHGWAGIPNPTDEQYFNGYFAEKFEKQLDYLPSKLTTIYINPTNRNDLDTLIGLCKRQNISLTLISSPMFAGAALDVKNRNQIVTQLKNIARINHLPYYDFSRFLFCNQRQYFLDHYHLKQKGAKIFSVYFSEKCFKI